MYEELKVSEVIELSIQKWQRIVAGISGDNRSDDCPLCQRFFLVEDTCKNCPIFKYTGVATCLETPYIKWLKAVFDEHEGYENTCFPAYATTETLVAIAKQELYFLKVLLLRELEKENENN